MSDETFRKAGKELVDVVQAFIDPEMTEGKLKEIQEAGLALWNLAEAFPGMDLKAVVLRVILGAANDVADDYFPLTTVVEE